MYGAERVRVFGPVKLRRVRDSRVGRLDARIKSKEARPVSRQHINGILRRIRRVFKWAASQELVPFSVYQSLQTVEGLKKGRTEARESQAVSCIDDAHVDAVLSHVSPQVAAMIESQRLTHFRKPPALLVRTNKAPPFFCERNGASHRSWLEHVQFRNRWLAPNRSQLPSSAPFRGLPQTTGSAGSY